MAAVTVAAKVVLRVASKESWLADELGCKKVDE